MGLPTTELVEGFVVIVPNSSTTANDVGLTSCPKALSSGQSALTKILLAHDFYMNNRIIKTNKVSKLKIICEPTHQALLNTGIEIIVGNVRIPDTIVRIPRTLETKKNIFFQVRCLYVIALNKPNIVSNKTKTPTKIKVMPR